VGVPGMKFGRIPTTFLSLLVTFLSPFTQMPR
jgi:hypothetical protein